MESAPALPIATQPRFSCKLHTFGIRPRKRLCGVTIVGASSAETSPADKAVAVIAMIEDPEAVEHIDEILAVEGLDAIFIGRGDLTVAYGAASKDAPAILEAVARILAAAGRADTPVCLMTDSLAEAKTFSESGASAFIVSSDQAFMRKAARAALAEFSTLKK